MVVMDTRRYAAISISTQDQSRFTLLRIAVTVWLVSNQQTSVEIGV
jgi:hypothetical protein